VTFTGTDQCLNSSTAGSSVTVADTSGPVIDVQPQIAGGHAYLWPPQHGYVDFTIADTGFLAHDVLRQRALRVLELPFEPARGRRRLETGGRSVTASSTGRACTFAPSVTAPARRWAAPTP